MNRGLINDKKEKYKISKEAKKEFKQHLADIKKGKITPDYPLHKKPGDFHGF